MAILTAVVTCIAIVTAINMVLVLGLMRRLRLGKLGSTTAPVSPPPGVAIGTFDAITVDDVTITDNDLRDAEVVAVFVSGSCDACGRLIKQLKRTKYLAQRVMIFGTRGDSAFVDELETLSHLGDVVFLEDAEPVKEAFSVTMVPTILRVLNGVVVSSAYRLVDLGGLPDSQATSNGVHAHV
jgi:hypothetical protein